MVRGQMSSRISLARPTPATTPNGEPNGERPNFPTGAKDHETDKRKPAAAVACTDLLGHVITVKDIERTKEDMGEQATREMLPRSAFDFTPRPPGRSFAARGGLKEWPDEWRCKTCAWCGTTNPDAKHVWCRKWRRSMWANSDRACFDETGEMMMARDLHAMKTQNDQAHT